MINSLFIVNVSGDIVLEKHYKSVIHRSICDYFFDLQKKVGSPEDCATAFQTESKLYLVMDFLQGGDLFSRLSGEYLIGRYWTHKTTDFVGLSKEFELIEDKTFSFCGTIEYMAPEVVSRKGHTAVADWWSFGVLMYQMLIGRLPFLSHDNNHHHTIKLIVRGKCSLPPYLTGPLGFKKIHSHRFFSTINWQKLLHQKVPPPFKPIFSPTDDLLRYFDEEFTSEKAADLPDVPASSVPQDQFRNFDFIASDFVEKQERGIISNVFHSSLPCMTTRL
uniref:Protein kinase domain-containing protein n=1 Tax=Ditylenchus dipsaci TaxID=166011 RepID=A0A915DLF2_9BILA